MKISKRYSIFINPMTGCAFWGTKKFTRRVTFSKDQLLGEWYECTFRELIQNIETLRKKKYMIFARKH